MPAHEILNKWESFYVIVGSSAGALTGLQFVVMAIIADQPGRGGHQEIAAFGTPTVVHFMAVLFIGAIISAPWEELSHAALVLGFFGLTGVVYTAVVTERAKGSKRYQPVLEDWIFHAILPFVAYLLVLVGAIMVTRFTEALFSVATASLVLLSVGVHNAWDTVTYLALDMPGYDRAPGQGGTPPTNQ